MNAGRHLSSPFIRTLQVHVHTERTKHNWWKWNTEANFSPHGKVWSKRRRLDALRCNIRGYLSVGHVTSIGINRTCPNEDGTQHLSDDLRYLHKALRLLVGSAPFEEQHEKHFLHLL
ncbi:hypothetical protein OUZ56_015730 [Daphnia magna]|uniref:Uncharacterized protein n=1 Tax=Daphnia magna TaxID=35525 RepID=A0ABR0ANK3_9CRUS|nr:hypothetical protein OUZ56_015730 [Daphnia magna]